MSKRVFVLLVLLMSMSLIGIIFVQAYYIKDSVKNERERFSFNVKKTLSYVSNAIEENELDTYFEKYQKLINDKKVDSVAVSQLFIYQQNRNTKETLIYKSGVLEENYKLSSSLFDIGLDSINIKNIIGSSNLEVYKNEDISEKDLSKSPIVNIINSGRLLPAERNYFEKNYKKFPHGATICELRSGKERYTIIPESPYDDNGETVEWSHYNEIHEYSGNIVIDVSKIGRNLALPVSTTAALTSIPSFILSLNVVMNTKASFTKIPIKAITPRIENKLIGKP